MCVDRFLRYLGEIVTSAGMLDYQMSVWTDGQVFRIHQF